MGVGNVFFVVFALLTPKIMDKIGKKNTILVGGIINGISWIAFGSLDYITNIPIFNVVALVTRIIGGTS